METEKNVPASQPGTTNPSMIVRRRGFLKGALLAGASVALPLSAHALGAKRQTPQLPEPEIAFFTPDERNALGQFADRFYPNASSMGAVNYIENLMTALEFDPPRAFLAPDKDPQGNPHYLPLTRVKLQAWQLRLYGADGSSGMRAQMKAGAQKLVSCMQGGTMSWAATFVDSDFRDSFSALVLESVFSMPEYGGNFRNQGWQGVYFEGPSMPKGYSLYDPTSDSFSEFPDNPVSSPNPGADPHPLGLITRIAARVIALFETKAGSS